MKFLLAFILLFSFQYSFAQHNAIQATNEVRITGSVRIPLIFTIADLLKFKQDTLAGVQMYSAHGNEKEAVRNMKGVLLKTLLDSAHIEATDHKG